MEPANRLALWILQRSDRPVSHLKLQKLLFFCYGAASAFDQESSVGPVEFEAWEHGPVNRSVYREYRSFGASDLPASGPTVKYPWDLTCTVSDALAVYGSLDAWSLRQQSHLEKPWIDARNSQVSIIPHDDIKHHFRSKFSGPRVNYPEYLADAGSFRLDRIPVRGFSSLRELANAVR